MFYCKTLFKTNLYLIIKSNENRSEDPTSGQIDGIPKAPKIQSDCSPEDVYYNASQAFPFIDPFGKED